MRCYGNLKLYNDNEKSHTYKTSLMHTEES
jgi:hypothetical protein